MMTDRIAALDGVLNFRDFGGYAAQDGHVVRGKLFRTASFAEASERDRAWLDALGARFVVDLRRPEEREDAPNRWPGEGAPPVHTNDEGYREIPAHLAVLTETDLSAESVRQYMFTAYANYPYEPRYVRLYRTFLHGLADSGGPAIVHCAAGKDRTGVICALTLTALGVDHDTIVADYELTNTAVDYMARLPAIRERMEARVGKPVPEEALRPMLGVHKDYLDAAWAAIHARYPDVRTYMADVLGVDDAMVRELRAKFVA
ncbi:MAG: tyrosine-protein phosphatase [Hyphomonadaceae bacterium]|nr:tyrosine-protein phosphatase [Hyphomonadaceae bacterium]